MLDFLNTTKYPPSLLFLLMTLGPAAIFCAYAERWRGWLKDTFVMYGRVPFAFYVVHWFLIHTLCLVLGAVQGMPVTALMTFPAGYPPEYGLPLPGVYLVWLLRRGLAVSVGALDGGRQDAQPRLVAELRVNGDIPHLLAIGTVIAQQAVPVCYETRNVPISVAELRGAAQPSVRIAPTTSTPDNISMGARKPPV